MPTAICLLRWASLDGWRASVLEWPQGVSESGFVKCSGGAGQVARAAPVPAPSTLPICQLPLLCVGVEAFGQVSAPVFEADVEGKWLNNYDNFL